MKCAAVIDRLLAGAAASDVDINSHVNSCRRCAEMAEITRGLAELGQAERKQDLSPSAQAATQRAVADVLSAPAPSRVIAFPVPAMTVRLAHACVWAVIVFGVVLLFTQRARLTVPGDQLAAQPDVTVTALDSRIRTQRLRVDRRLQDLSTAYLARSTRSRFETQTSDLRHRIEICSLQAQRDLDMALR